MARARTAACLCLTGGGVKARFTTAALEALQEMRDRVYPEGDAARPLACAFDLLAGTSAGALVAGGLALGRSPARTSAVIEAFGPRIFPGGRARVLRWFLAAKYDPGPLHEAVDEVLDGDTRTLGEFSHVLAFTAIDESLGLPVVLTNADPAHSGVPLRDAVLASAAAPTYFPAHRIKALGGRRFVDGGLYANAPDVAALTLALRRWKGLGLQDMQVVSVGTTFDSPASPHGPDHPGAGGVLSWAGRPPGRILKLAMRGTADHAIDLMDALPLAEFVRIDAPMQGVELDTATKASMDALRDAGRAAVEELSQDRKDALKGIVRRRREDPRTT